MNERNLVIDCSTTSANQIISVLSDLDSTLNVDFTGPYVYDQSICQVHLKTRLTEKEVDYFLWTCNLDYFGVVER